jgi:hypothetical protein
MGLIVNARQVVDHKIPFFDTLQYNTVDINTTVGMMSICMITISTHSIATHSHSYGHDKFDFMVDSPRNQIYQCFL